MAYGLGLRAEGFACESTALLDDEQALKDLLVAAIEVAGMRLMAGPFVAREPVRPVGKGPGVTACAILYESHVVIHTYPEQAWFLFEMTSCKKFNVERVENLLRAWADCMVVSKCEEVGEYFPEPVET